MAGGKRKDNKGRILQSGEYQRKNGTYEWRYKDADHKQKAVYAETLKDLREKKKDILRDLMDGIRTAEAGQTLSELVNKNNRLQNYQNESTIDHYAKLEKYFDRFPLHERSISNIKESDCREFIIQMNEVFSNSTTKHITDMCSRAMKAAVNDDLIRKNPFDFNWHGLLKYEPKKKKFLTDDEFHNLLDFLASSNVYRYYVPHITFLRETGLRISEFAALRLSDINFDNRTVDVNYQLYLNPNTRVMSLKYPKTKSSIGKVPLTKTAVKALESIIDKTRGETCEVPNEFGEMVSGLFVLGKNENRPIPAPQWYEIFSRINRAYNKANPDKPLNFTPHTLRHTCASRMIRDGVNLKAVQKVLRHASSNITLSIYADQTEDETAAELRRVYG